MPVLYINRIRYEVRQTLGYFVVFDELKKLYEGRTMELAWRNNQLRISCIPAGSYECIKHTSPKFGLCFWVQDVPGRSEILIHPGNYNTDLLGCIAPGRTHTDINKDGMIDVTNSRATLKKLLEVLPDIFILAIYGKH